MDERCDITLRQADEGPNPPDLLHQIVEDIKNLVPTIAETAGKYIKAKGEQELAKAQEIKDRVYERFDQLEVERQRLIQQCDEAIRNVEVQREHDREAYEERVQELETKRLREKTQSLKVVVNCIRSLRELGVEVEMDVVKRAVSNLLKEDDVS